MEPLLILQTCVILLAISACGGLTMAIIRFGGRPHPPAWLAMAHGFLSAAAVTLLAYAALTVGLPRLAELALVLFLVAAAGGAFLNLGYHWKGLALPKGIIVAHATIAVIGFALLVVAWWTAAHPAV